VLRCTVSKTSRVILRRLIDAVCYFANQQLPFRRRNESFTSLNKTDLVEYQNVLKNHGPHLANHLNSATVT